jgi:hypothetical protein
MFGGGNGPRRRRGGSRHSSRFRGGGRRGRARWGPGRELPRGGKHLGCERSRNFRRSWSRARPPRRRRRAHNRPGKERRRATETGGDRRAGTRKGTRQRRFAASAGPRRADTSNHKEADEHRAHGRDRHEQPRFAAHPSVLRRRPAPLDAQGLHDDGHAIGLELPGSRHVSTRSGSLRRRIVKLVYLPI